MAIFFYTSNPAAALNALRQAANTPHTTWDVTPGDVFSYTPTNWLGILDFEAVAYPTYVLFRVIPIQTSTKVTYAQGYPVLHGRFVEFLMAHGGAYLDSIVVKKLSKKPKPTLKPAVATAATTKTAGATNTTFKSTVKKPRI